MALPRVPPLPTGVQASIRARLHGQAWAAWIAMASWAPWAVLLAVAVPLEAHFGDRRTIDADTLPPPGWVIVGEVRPGPAPKPVFPAFPGLPEPNPGPGPWPFPEPVPEPFPGPVPEPFPGPLPGPMPRAHLVILDLNGAPMGATAEVMGHSPLPPGWVVISRRPAYPETMRRGTRLVIQNRFCFAPPGPDGPPDPQVPHGQLATEDRSRPSTPSTPATPATPYGAPGPCHRLAQLSRPRSRARSHSGLRAMAPGRRPPAVSRVSRMVSASWA